MGLAGLSIIHLLCICDWLFMMDESAWFGMDPSEDKDDLDEWSLVFEAVSQPDRIRNSVSVSRQPSCKSAPLPAPAYRHDLSVSRVHSRASSSCQFGGLAPRLSLNHVLSPELNRQQACRHQMYNTVFHVVCNCIMRCQISSTWMLQWIRHFNLLRPGNCQVIPV